MEAAEVRVAVGNLVGVLLEDRASTLLNSFELLKVPEIWIGNSGWWS